MVLRPVRALALMRGIMNNNPDLAVVSDCVLDIYYRVRSLPIDKGAVALSDVLVISPGGACTTAIMARKLGFKVMVIDRFGDDAFSELLLNMLKDLGINLDFTVRTHGNTTISNNIIDEQGNHAFLGYLGVGANLSINDINENVIKTARALFINTFYASLTKDIIPTFAHVMSLARNYEIPIFLDVGHVSNNKDDLINMISLADTIFMNEEETERLFDQSLDSVLNSLRTLGKVFVIKLGNRGAMLVDKDRVITCKPYSLIKVITTVGAGDAFDAGYIAGILSGLDPADACDLGNRVASIRINYLTPLDTPDLTELLKAYAK